MLTRQTRVSFFFSTSHLFRRIFSVVLVSFAITASSSVMKSFRTSSFLVPSTTSASSLSINGCVDCRFRHLHECNVLGHAIGLNHGPYTTSTSCASTACPCPVGGSPGGQSGTSTNPCCCLLDIVEVLRQHLRYKHRSDSIEPSRHSGLPVQLSAELYHAFVDS
jgi:hypothetical protein